jgi:hypothetical protein
MLQSLQLSVSYGHGHSVPTLSCLWLPLAASPCIIRYSQALNHPDDDDDDDDDDPDDDDDDPDDTKDSEKC